MPRHVGHIAFISLRRTIRPTAILIAPLPGGGGGKSHSDQGRMAGDRVTEVLLGGLWFAVLFERTDDLRMHERLELVRSAKSVRTYIADGRESQ